MCCWTFLAQFGDQPLRRLRQQAASSENEVMPWISVAASTRQHQRRQQLRLMLADDIVDQIFGGHGQHQAAQPVDHHQHKAEREDACAAAGSSRGCPATTRGMRSDWLRFGFLRNVCPRTIILQCIHCGFSVA